MTFRPNMTQHQIKEEDEHRGHPFAHTTPTTPPAFKALDSGDTTEGEEGEDTSEEEEEDMAYSIPTGEDFGKPLPEKKKRKDESEFQHKIRQWTEEVEERPGRFPGGKKQAVAIAAEQAGVAKKSLDEMTARLSKSAESRKQDADSVEKALSTRSMHIPRPNSVYDPFEVLNSARRQITRSQSRLRGPEGVAPLVGETFEQLAEDEKPKSHGEVFKSCLVHGITYRPGVGCHPCRVAKSQHCTGCGAQLVKSIGGASSCPVCG